MTPAPSSSRNRRSATLASISTPAGPPPAPPPGHPGTYPHTALGHSNSISNHSPHSSFSSHSGPISNSNSSNNNNHYSTPPSSFAPPRASFSSSSRASPVGPPSSGRSGRERDQDAWNDSAWRSIFDAALVKAQQAVQLDELQETTLAANLYAQAANDLGRVIPMCSSEKKKQSMLAIQAIYLDRVTQLRDSSLAKSGGSHPGASPAHSAATTESNEGHNYRYSVNSRNMGYVDDQYQPQQYQHQQYQPHNQQVQQQQHYQSPLLSPVQQYQAPQFQQLQQHQEPPPQPQQQQSSGLRLFGKKRSKTQSSVSQPPPEFTQQFHGQGQNYNFNQNNNNNNNGYGYADPAGAYTVPFVAPPRIPSPPPVVSPIFMTHPPAPKNQLNDSSAAVSVQEQPAKSSKWRPFGKKKSKSLSNPETSKAFTPPPEMAPSVPVIPPHVEPEPVPVQYLQQQQEFQQQQHFLEEQEHHYLEEQQQQQQDEEVVEYRGEEFKNPARGDWYVESTPETPVENSYEYDEFENPAHYFDEEDEDVDPYYIADTKGRARAFEGQDTGVKDKGKSIKEPEAASESNTRKPLTHNSSSYSQEQSFSPKFEFSQAEPMVGLQTQLVNQDQPSEHPTNERAHTSNFTDNVHGENNTHIHDNSINGHHQNTQGHHSQETSEFVAASQIEDGEMAKSTLESVGGHNEAGVEAEPAAAGVATVEKTKTKRTWYGKKKKEKDPEKEKEKQKQKELDRLDTVARLMDDALFGAPSKPKLDKEKLKEKTSAVSLDKTPSHHTHDPADRPHQPIESAPVLAEVNFSESHISTQQDKDDAATNEQDESNIEEPYVLPEISEPYVLPEVSEPANSESGIITTTTGQEAPSTVSGQEAPSIVSGQEAPSSVSGQEELFVVSDPPKRSKSRHFSIFKSKKNKDVDIHQQALDGSPLSPTVTNDETKSVHSHHTRQSTYSTDRKVEPPVVVRPKEKEVVKKRDSDEYVPYEYQEELEGPLMERVEVPEHREVIGFVLPVEEIMDYTLEGNEEAALENWDSWVSQLESFEKVLSDKGLKKEKAKKVKKVKEVKPEDQGLPMSSTKANRSSIFGSLGRSDTLRSRNNTTLELNTQVMENRSLSMSTTLLDDIPTRPSFQSSRSGESEAPSQFLVAPQTKKRWWKRKETNSFYRASNALSTADLEQDQHLSALLRSQTQVRSSDNLPQDHGLMSMPISFVEPMTPVQELSKEAPAAMESVPAPASEPAPAPAPEPAPEVKGKEQESEQEPELKVEKIVEKKVEQVKEKEEAEEAEAEAEVAIAPMPKPKAKSSKPKLLPISTPLPQLLKIESAEELWQYVQQAKTYATSRMNKGDKRSAAIALKRAQALEARWQEILLEMASSGEDTDELLEEDDEESSDSSEEVPAPVVVAPPPKKEKAKKVVVQAPVDGVEDVVTAPAPVPVAPVPIAAPAPTPTPVAAVKPITTVAASVANEDEDDEEENYAAHRRRNTISRSSSTIDKYSKYKTNKSATSASNNTNVVSSQASATEDNADAKSVSSTKTAATTTSESDSGRLGPEATLEQMLESKNIDHVKYYIQRMKTDTVTKARNGSKFAALEGMKNVKVLQQHLADLLDPKDDKEEEEEKEKEAEVQATKSSVPAPSEERIITVQPTIQEEDEEEDEEDEKATKAPTQETKEETKAPIEKEV